MVRERVRYAFGSPGTTELPLMDLFAARDEIKYILAQGSVVKSKG